MSSFHKQGFVSLWLTRVAFRGIPRAYLEGTDELLIWLNIDYGVEIDAAFSTNWADAGKLAPVAELLAPLHCSESFAVNASKAATARGIEQASFVIALYDTAYDSQATGLPHPDHESKYLTWLGCFGYHEG